ncbi:hypothetical protein JW962_01610 [Candidatus Dojkabacteria bacterium]|nr:hypothetical protein [Candidatus Dojkabacteria bacterium]
MEDRTPTEKAIDAQSVWGSTRQHVETYSFAPSMPLITLEPDKNDPNWIFFKNPQDETFPIWLNKETWPEVFGQPLDTKEVISNLPTQQEIIRVWGAMSNLTEGVRVPDTYADQIIIASEIARQVSLDVPVRTRNIMPLVIGGLVATGTFLLLAPLPADCNIIATVGAIAMGAISYNIGRRFGQDRGPQAKTFKQIIDEGNLHNALRVGMKVYESVRPPTKPKEMAAAAALPLPH